ncbi:lipocalin-like domain-containing protein [Streptomyces sp. NPDC056831]|uniref:lipocalin-like domain-containing protein n=1 Tax=Streptomyces sp. NPDC056831 TaxID=3345954 RepID=UPI0036A2CDEF
MDEDEIVPTQLCPEAQKPRSPEALERKHVYTPSRTEPHCRPAHRPDAAEHPLVGAWLLSTVAIVDVSGHTLEHPLGQRPTGLITYTADGHMSVSMLNPELESGAAAETGTGEPVDTATLFRTSPYLGYAGAYEVMGDLVVHHLHVASLRPWVGTKQERRWKVEGDRLTLLPPTEGTGDEARTPRLVWHRPTGDST